MAVVAASAVPLAVVAVPEVKLPSCAAPVALAPTEPAVAVRLALPKPLTNGLGVPEASPVRSPFCAVTVTLPAVAVRLPVRTEEAADTVAVLAEVPDASRICPSWLPVPPLLYA